MRRFPALRIVTMIAILLVASSLSTGAIGPNDCECCGPLVGAPAGPVAPCCVGATDRRVALFTHPHVTATPLPDIVEGPHAAARIPPVMDDEGYPPGSGLPLYLRHAVLRI